MDLLCQGVTCQNVIDTDTGDNYHARDAKVARKETTDKATDVSLEHWGRGAELNGDQVAGSGRYVEAPDGGHWGQVEKSSCENAPGVESPDEVLDVSSGHWGQVAVLSHD